MMEKCSGGFKQIHPSQTGRMGQIPHDKNFQPQGGRERDDTRYYCKQCGMVNDTRRRAKGRGNGIIHTQAGTGVMQVSVASGCAFCGSRNYV